MHPQSTLIHIKMTNNLQVIHMSQVQLPKFTPSNYNYQDWIRYGDDNLFPQMLQNLANRSAVHNAILSSKVDNCIGNGLTYEKKKDTKTDTWMTNPNPYDTLEHVYRKIVYDYVMYGGYALNVIWSKDHKSIAEIYHIDFANIRCGKMNAYNQIDNFHYSKDWTNYRKAEYKPIVIPAYSTKNKDASQLMYVKEYRPGTDYYPLPSYVGALSYIETDVEISNFHLAHIKNGMTPSMMINFVNGEPTEEEKTKIDREIKSCTTGTDNAGKYLITYSTSKETAAVITTMATTQLDKQFIQLQGTVLQNILSGHKIVSPMLVGIQTPGSLGGKSELETAYNIYNKSVIDPIQNITLVKLNEIQAINGLQQLTVIPIDPLSFSWSENVLTTIMSVDEMRAKIDLPALENIVPEAEQIIEPIIAQ